MVNKTMDFSKRYFSYYASYDDISAMIVSKASTMQEYEARLKHLKHSLKDYTFQKSFFKATLQRLKDSPKIKEVKFTMTDRGILKVTTKTLYCTDPRTGLEHEIGKMEIKIYVLHPARYCVSNVTRTVYYPLWGTYMAAPHIRADGTICHGATFEDILNRLQYADEHVAIVFAIIHFIESVNVADRWGQNINRWPISKRSKRAQAQAQKKFVFLDSPE